MTSISVTRRPPSPVSSPVRAPLARLADGPVPPPVRRLLERPAGVRRAGFASSI